MQQFTLGKFSEKNFWECQDSNPGPLGAKRVCYPLCYAAPQFNDSYFRMNPTSPDQFFNRCKVFRCKVNSDLVPHLSSSSEFAQSNDQLNAALLDTSDTIGPFVLMLSFDVPLKMPVSLKFLATNFAVKLSMEDVFT